MTLQDIINVLTIVQEKNFSRAAARLYVSQSAISQSVARLEQELGVPLFLRSTKEVRPTEEGLLFVEKGKPVVDAYNQFCTDMKHLVSPNKQRLRVGVSSFFSRYLTFQKEVRHDREKYPFDVEIVEDTGAVVEQMTIDRRVDFAFARAPLRQNKLEYEPLFTEQIFLMVPAIHPICEMLPVLEDDPYPTVPLEYFKDSSFVMITNSLVTSNCIKMCQDAGFTPHVVASTTVWERIYTNVVELDLVGFISSIFAKPYSSDSLVRYFRIDSELASLEHIVAYLSRDKLSANARTYIDAFRDFLLPQLP